MAPTGARHIVSNYSHMLSYLTGVIFKHLQVKVKFIATYRSVAKRYIYVYYPVSDEFK